MRKALALIAALFLVVGCVPAQAADNLTVLDGTRATKVLKAKEISSVLYRGMIPYTETGNPLQVEDDVLSTIEHAHGSRGQVHFHVENISADYRCILVDLSDSTNWPHTETSVVHIEDIDAQVDSSGTAEWDLELIFLEDCSASDCDSIMFWGASGSKSTGNNLETFIPWGNRGPELKTGTDGVISSMLTNDDTTYQTDVKLCDVRTPAAANTYPGNGDLIIYVNWIAGSFDLNLNITYHTHSATH